MFYIRLFTGICLLIAAFICVSNGGWLLLSISMLLSLIGTFEMIRVFKLERSVVGYLAYISVFCFYLSTYFFGDKYHLLLFAFSIMLMMGAYVFTFPKYNFEDMTKAYFIFIYVGVLLSFLFQTRELRYGRYFVWLIFISSWGSDTFAYVFGITFGKHKLAPVVSPNKSVEGSLGGIFGSAVLGYVFGYFFGSHMSEVHNPAFVCAVASAIGSVISQIGDLAASAIKRNYQVKDFGDFFPGHGGVIDRFDSMLFTAPAVFFALRFLA